MFYILFHDRVAFFFFVSYSSFKIFAISSKNWKKNMKKTRKLFHRREKQRKWRKKEEKRSRTTRKELVNFFLYDCSNFFCHSFVRLLTSATHKRLYFCFWHLCFPYLSPIAKPCKSKLTRKSIRSFFIIYTWVIMILMTS